MVTGQILGPHGLNRSFKHSTARSPWAVALSGTSPSRRRYGRGGPGRNRLDLTMDDSTDDPLLASRNDRVSGTADSEESRHGKIGSALEMTDHAQGSEWPEEKSRVRNRIGDSGIRVRRDARDRRCKVVVPIHSSAAGTESFLFIAGRRGSSDVLDEPRTKYRGRPPPISKCLPRL